MVLAHLGHDAGALAVFIIPAVAYAVTLFNRRRTRRATGAQAATGSKARETTGVSR